MAGFGAPPNGRSGRDWGKETLRAGSPGRFDDAVYVAEGLRGERGVIWSVEATVGESQLHWGR